MKFQSLHDEIDPEVPPAGEAVDPPPGDPNAPDDAYVIGERFQSVLAPEGGTSTKKKRRARGLRVWVRPLALLLSAACVGLTIWNLARLVQGPPAPPKPTAFQVRQALYLGVLRVEAFRRVHGVTPASLADAGLPDANGYTYQRIDPAHYALAFQADGPREQYDSATPMEQVFGSPEKMLAMGGAQ
ncbi:MAG TPA: hypothetical protein VFB67_05735 [Candidatus Polarisedimenticolaceae bacterium]|nr:hypothetical protein [Candidatus Polarisedimenticolaceae bacterium]